MRTNVVYRPLVEFQERADVVYALGAYAFDPSPPLSDRAEWDKWLKNAGEATIIAGFDGDKAVAMSCSSPMTQQVRGAIYPMSAIWGVATHPAARRRGHINTLMQQVLASVREAGAPLTCLYPFRPSFYERMGYVPFPQPRVAKFDPADLAGLLKCEPAGEVELLPMQDGHAIYRQVVQAAQKRLHGMAVVSNQISLNEKDRDEWLAIARVDGEPVGAMRYTIKGSMDDFTMRVPRFYALTAQARYLLLGWFARHIDQVQRVHVRVPPSERPATWWFDLATLETERVWPPMGRVLDVAGIGGMQVGESAGFTVRVSDPLCAWNEGAWTFAAADGALTVSPVDDGAAACDLTIQALSALVYGTVDPEVFTFRGWGDPSPATQDAMRDLFPPMLPYLHEQF
jgi:predicted acetyltransferase